jgi:hypothetical protein
MSSASLLLDDVKDWPSFAEFVRALAAERHQAEQMERNDPVRYQLGGALDWQNSSISQYLECALSCIEDNDVGESETPSWKLMAEFLYAGKIYE